MTTPPPDKAPSPITPGRAPEALEKPVPSGQPPSNFQAYMQDTAPSKGESTTPAANGPTPMDVTRGASFSTSGISFDTLLAQANGAQDSLGTVESQLNDKKLKLNRSQSHLVKQKLSDANEHIRTAGGKLGLSLAENQLPAGLSPIARFIAMINDGQDKLYEVQEQLKKLAARGENINPGDMLSIQVKMGLANQEIQYTSTLLGKVIQSITQLMNTQL